MVIQILISLVQSYKLFGWCYALIDQALKHDFEILIEMRRIFLPRCSVLSLIQIDLSSTSKQLQCQNIFIDSLYLQEHSCVK